MCRGLNEPNSRRCPCSFGPRRSAVDRARRQNKLTQAAASAGEQAIATTKVLPIGSPIVPARDHEADDTNYETILTSARDDVDTRLRLLLADALADGADDEDDDSEEEEEAFIEDIDEVTEADEDELEISQLIFEDDEDETETKPKRHAEDGVAGEQVVISDLAGFRAALKPGTRVVMETAERRVDGEWVAWAHPELGVMRTIVRPFGLAGFEMDSGPDLVPSTDFTFEDGTPKFESKLARMTYSVTVPPRAAEDQKIAAALEKSREAKKIAPRGVKAEAAYSRALERSLKLASGDPLKAVWAFEDDFAARATTGWSSEEGVVSAASRRGLTRSEWEAVTDSEDGGQQLARETELNDAWTKSLTFGLAKSAAGSEDRYEFALKLRGLRVEAQRLAERKAKLGMRGSE